VIFDGRKWLPWYNGRTTFYDSRSVKVIDPFGNRIRFNEKL